MISLVLAAGKGTRMKSELPKVLHTVNGIPMLVKVKNVLENVGIEENIFIFGHKKEEVLEAHGGHEKLYYFEFDKTLPERSLIRRGMK